MPSQVSVLESVAWPDNDLIMACMGAGQSHDGYFEFSRSGQVKHVLGTAKLVSEKGVTIKDGTVIPADMVVFCGGCEYQGSPPFLADLKLGQYSIQSLHGAIYKAPRYNSRGGWMPLSSPSPLTLQGLPNGTDGLVRGDYSHLTY